MELELLSGYSDKATGYTEVESCLFSLQGKNFYVVKRVHTDSGTHPASCLVDNGAIPRMER